MTTVGIIQSSYIPWKGYFDILACSDVFYLYDEVQYTKNDWRNRNRIPGPSGSQWLTIPVRRGTGMSSLPIDEIEVVDHRWAGKHWRTLEQRYGKARGWDYCRDALKDAYSAAAELHRISEINVTFIRTVASLLGIATDIRWSRDVPREVQDRTQRLIELCTAADGDRYVSGPAASAYLDETLFAERGISVAWADYRWYPEYSQSTSEFEHGVSIIDLLANTGEAAPEFMYFGNGELRDRFLRPSNPVNGS